MRTFVVTDAKSHKFWNIELHGDSFTVSFGRVGTKGQAQTKTFPDEAEALRQHDKLVTEKLAKGVGDRPCLDAGRKDVGVQQRGKDRLLVASSPRAGRRGNKSPGGSRGRRLPCRG
jgi:predicted DNA-binding WGR domain protein